MRFIKIVLILSLLWILAACAPDNLDITPSPVPTQIPQIQVYITGAVATPEITITLNEGSRVSDAVEMAGGTTENADLEQVNMAQILRDGVQIHVPSIGDAVVEATPEATVEAVVSESQALLDHLIAGIPAQINASSQWRRGIAQECKDREEVVYTPVEGGITASLCYGETGGGLSYLFIGVFDTPEAAAAYYALILDRTRTLDRPEERDVSGNYTFPKPNAFGGGTYGSDAIFLKDNLFIQVSVPRFSSTSGEPLSPMARSVLRALDDALGSFTPS